MASINTALASLKINTGSVVGNVQLSVAATVNPVGYFYNGVNGHFYRPIATGATYTNARAASLSNNIQRTERIFGNNNICIEKMLLYLLMFLNPVFGLH
jgi:hypothetical protein